MLGDRREAFYDALFTDVTENVSFEHLSLRVALDLIFTCDVLHQIVARDLANHGLSRSTYNILMLLQQAPEEGMQLHDLGELLLVSRANITGLVDHLEQKGWATRTVDATDRRARFARITPLAEELLHQVTPAHNENIDLLFEGVTEEEKRSLISLLRKLRSSMAAECGSRPAGMAGKRISNKD